MEKKVITAYTVFEDDTRVRLHPAPKERDWMDNSPNAYAYRCLPLNIANQHGWCIYLNQSLSAYWDGNPHKESLKILDNDNRNIADSYFGMGVLTFHIGHIIQTPPGYSLYISGAPNFFKPDIQAMTGVYESDWGPYSFTMNWKFTKPNIVSTFSPLEPICFFFPIQRDLIENFSLEMKNLSENKELYDKHWQFAKSRSQHQKNMDSGVTPKDDWQKHYFQGKYPDGSICPVDHKTKLKIDGEKDPLLPKDKGI